MLTLCINLSHKTGNMWFETVAYPLRAYSLIKLKKIKEALLDIEYLEKYEKRTGEKIDITWMYEISNNITLYFLRSLTV